MSIDMTRQQSLGANRPFTQLRPFQQGNLDALCSVYAVINATRYAVGPTPLSSDDWHNLFHRLVDALHDRDVLCDIIKEGTGMGLVRLMLRTLQDELNSSWGVTLKTERPFSGVGKSCLSEVVRCLDAHLLSGDASALIHLRGHHRHWTVVKRITPRTLQLFDSDGMKLLPLSQITVGSLKRCNHPIKLIAPHLVLMRASRGP